MPSTIKYCMYIILCILQTACTDEKQGAEQQIRDWVTAARTQVEQPNPFGFKDMIADDYRDTNQLDKKMLHRRLTAYLLGHKNLHLYTQIKTIHLTDNKHADVQVFIAMAGQTIHDTSALLNLKARSYLIDLRLIKEDGDWQVSNADWRVASVNELLNN
ncbi:MAG: hypothetical protein OEY43_04110 [Gammaproteobacteria bacterium]|nr:hypothetical protein [Gammaproteobacteria bacterium]